MSGPAGYQDQPAASDTAKSEPDAASLANRKVALEISEIHQKLSEYNKPFWKRIGFTLAIIPILATLLVSAGTLTYTVYWQQFSEISEEKLAIARKESEKLDKEIALKSLELEEKQDAKEKLLQQINEMEEKIQPCPLAFRNYRIE